MSSPFFSIIVPIYKARLDYLDVCVRSILNQSFRDIELILVDDGSPDKCGEVCNNYAREDDRVRAIHQENKGVSVARNNGIDNATADWIMFVDADDWLELDACERLQQYVDDSDCDILLFSGIREYADRHITMNYGLQHGQTYNTANIDERELLYRQAMQTTNVAKSAKTKLWPIYYSWDKVYRRKFLTENNIRYPQGLPKSEDKVFILRCFEKLSKLHCVCDALYHYRINAGSICNRYSENADIDRIKLVGMLQDIAARMDKELGRLKNDDEYSVIARDYKRFVFWIISDVLSLKYYHPDCPYDKRTRKREALAFLKTDPFRSALREISYPQLSFEGKLRKLLLSHGLITTFLSIRRLYRKLTKQLPEG